MKLLDNTRFIVYKVYIRTDRLGWYNKYFIFSIFNDVTIYKKEVIKEESNDCKKVIKIGYARLHKVSTKSFSVQLLYPYPIKVLNNC